jgi:lysophospholipase L1-like esterase
MRRHLDLLALACAAGLAGLAALWLVFAPSARAQPATAPTDAAVMKTVSTSNLTANLSTGNRTLTIASGGTLNAVAGSNIILAGTTTLNGTISGNAVLGVAQGGTARTTLTADSILTGNTTGAVKSSEVYASSAYTVVALGDSITQLGSYPTRLGSLLGSGWQVLNEGITGQTTTAIAARVATSATERSTAAYVIVAAGINDVAQGVSAGTIQTNLQAIYTALSGAGKTVVALNIPPFGNNADWTSGKQAVSTAVRRAAAILRHDAEGWAKKVAS